MKVQRVCVCLLPALLGQSKPLSAENMKVNAQYHTDTQTQKLGSKPRDGACVTNDVIKR